MMMKKTLAIVIATSMATLYGCGGSSSGSTSSNVSGSNAAEVTSVGVITGFGSVIVNGVHYETNKSVFRIDDEAGDESSLTIGMEVEVRGRLSEDGPEGEADVIEYAPHVEGFIESIDLAELSFVVLGQTFLTDELTNFEGADFTQLKVGDRVEVSAQETGDGSWLAGYVGLKVEDNLVDTQVKIRGYISALDIDNSTFKLGDLIIDFSVADVKDAPADGLVDGLKVKVVADELPVEGVLLAAQVKVDMADDSVESEKEGRHFHIDGLITRFDSATDFDVNGAPVSAGAGTKYQHGDASNLALGVKVKVKGLRNDEGILTAEKIYIDKPGVLKMEGKIEAIDLEASTLTLLGAVINVGEQTHFKDHSKRGDKRLSLDDFAIGDGIELKAFVQSDGSILAKKIERESTASDSDKDHDEDGLKLIGFASDITESGFTLNEVVITLSESTEFEGVNDEALTMEAFLALLTEGSYLKVEGDKDENGNFVAMFVEFKNVKGLGSDDHKKDGDSDHDDLAKGKSHRVELEGVIDGFTSVQSFTVNGHLVTTSQVTRYKHGGESNLVQGASIEVKGFIVEEGVISATRIEFDKK
ncbi:MAG: hypothetical protein H7A01_11735 [Hahellaceae bacterium]|nr:hypothetical protein [Hahellaceae bacterium]MCP5210011.1 hypothetical protein [Hahellaceae bacterium]